jgi:hypothetical protein
VYEVPVWQAAGILVGGDDFSAAFADLARTTEFISFEVMLGALAGLDFFLVDLVLEHVRPWRRNRRPRLNTRLVSTQEFFLAVFRG